MARRTGWIAVAVVTALVLSVGTAAGERGHGSKLSKHDRAAIARDRARGDGSVTLLLETAPGGSAALVSSVQALGGSVRYSDDDLGYVRVDVPPAQADAVASLPGLQSIGLDQVIPLGPLPESVESQGPPDAGTGPLNPYLPAQDIGAPQFRQAHPTWDGRGVTVGILDSGVDPTRPELQTAKDARGRTVPKLVDWVASTDPATDGDGSWVELDDVHPTGRDRTFTAGGTTYTAPRGGSFGFGLFAEAALCPDAAAPSCEMGDDVDRDGDTSDTFGVLVARGGHNSTVWVDTNQDGSFTDQKPMREYRANHDVDYFGDAADETRRVPYVVDVERDGGDRYVDIGIVSGGHGTHVAGIVAGQGFFGGEMNGVAPGAQIVSARACVWPGGCTSHALIEGMIYLATRAKVDLINLSVGGLPLLNDGNSPRCDLSTRLIERTGTQIFVSAGNDGPGANTINDPATCDGVVSTGAYLSSATWAADLGVDGVADQISIFSSRGPRADGALAPLVAAPGAAVSTWPAWDTAAQVTPGYGFVQGTSQAAAEATGAAALLLSAAKQERLRVTPAQLRQALVSGAASLSGYGPEAQGNGLVQVESAWETLRQGGRPADVDSSARVDTVLSSHLEQPGRGPGLYVREGWAAGQSGTETITFTRRDRGTATYAVRWLGDPAFSSAGSITLPASQPVALQVSVAPLSPGLHSAIVQLDDPSSPGVEYETAATIAASEDVPAPGRTILQGQVNRADATPVTFLHVPEGVASLQVLTAQVPGGKVRPRLFTPAGVEASSTSLALDPAPGAWEIDAEGNRTSLPTAEFAMQATLYGVEASPAAVDLSGPAATQELSFTNRYFGFNGNAVGGPLASAYTATPTIADGASQEYAVDVPAGATSLTASIGKATEPSADLDLLLFDCTSGTCAQADASSGGTAEESVSAENPGAGRWKVVVVGAFVPTGTTGFTFDDAYTAPGLGSVSVDDPVAGHGPGTSWTATATVDATGSAGAGRFLRGVATVMGPGFPVGRAELDLR
jgi:hypothetical protein